MRTLNVGIDTLPKPNYSYLLSKNLTANLRRPDTPLHCARKIRRFVLFRPATFELVQVGPRKNIGYRRP